VTGRCRLVYTKSGRLSRVNDSPHFRSITSAIERRVLDVLGGGRGVLSALQVLARVLLAAVSSFRALGIGVCGTRNSAMDPFASQSIYKRTA
jgi:hypothetical protein